MDMTSLFNTSTPTGATINFFDAQINKRLLAWRTFRHGLLTITGQTFLKRQLQSPEVAHTLQKLTAKMLCYSTRAFQSLLIAAAVSTLLFHFSCADFYFGQSAALTGQTSDIGLAMQQGIIAAFSEINAQGGIQGGHMLRLVSLDDYYEPDPAVNNTQILANNQTLIGLLGYMGSYVLTVFYNFIF